MTAIPLTPLDDAQPVYSIHRWVRHDAADDYCRLGWVPQATLDGTTHGHWSVHVVSGYVLTARPSPPTGHGRGDGEPR